MASESERIFSFSISDENREQRLDTYLVSRVEDLTRSRVQGLVKNGFVKVNGRLPKTSYRIKKGDNIHLVIPPPIALDLEPEEVAFELIHEDASLIVLNKPPGLVIHPAPGHPSGTLVHGLLKHCRDLSGISGVLRPGIVHRLDKDTSGIIVVAKNDRVHNFLANQFKAGSVKKRYTALVHGIIKGQKGEIDLPIARHPRRRKEMAVISGGKPARTRWRKVEAFGNRLSLLVVSPKTGRTHQIRVHLSHVGHPIVGDAVYGVRQNWWKKDMFLMREILPKIARQMLHAQTLGFIHPDSENYCEFQAPLPDDMAQILTWLRAHVEKKT